MPAEIRFVNPSEWLQPRPDSGERVIMLGPGGQENAYALPNTGAFGCHAAESLAHGGRLRAWVVDSPALILVPAKCSVDTLVAALVVSILVSHPDKVIEGLPTPQSEDWVALDWDISREQPSNTAFRRNLFRLIAYAWRETRQLAVPCPAPYRLAALWQAHQQQPDASCSAAVNLLQQSLLSDPQSVPNLLFEPIVSLDSLRWRFWWKALQQDFDCFAQDRQAARHEFLPGDAGAPLLRVAILWHPTARFAHFWVSQWLAETHSTELDGVVVVTIGGATQWMGRPSSHLALQSSYLDELPLHASIHHAAWTRLFDQQGWQIECIDLVADTTKTTNAATAHDLVRLPDISEGFRFAVLKLPCGFGEPGADPNRQLLAPLLWRVIRTNPRQGFPSDFWQNHLQSDAGILVAWSRHGMCVAYLDSHETHSLVEDLRKRFVQIIALSRRAGQLVAEKQQQLSPKEDLKELESTITEYIGHRVALATPRLRLLRRFWAAINHQELLETVWRQLDSDRQASTLSVIRKVQVKLEWFEVLIIAFYFIEVAHVFLATVHPPPQAGHKPDPLNMLLVVAAVVGGLGAWWGLVDPHHDLPTERETRGRRILVMLFAGGLLAYSAFILWTQFFGH